MTEVIVRHEIAGTRGNVVYFDWDGGVFLENNKPHDNFELYSYVRSEHKHVVFVRPYNGNIITSVTVPI